LDRDRLSSEYVANIGTRIESLRLWRGGANHVVFNLYSGVAGKIGSYSETVISRIRISNLAISE